MTDALRTPRSRVASSLGRRDRALWTLGAASAATYLWPLAAAFTVATALAVVLAWVGWRFSPRGRLQRELGAGGWLDLHQLRTHAGARAVRRHSVRAAGTPGTVAEHAMEMGRLVSGPLLLRGRRVYSPLTRGVLVCGPQGSGKTSWLVDRIVRVPGAAYVTSTKLELVTMTGQQRQLVSPVAVFNPTALGGLPSSFAWDPVAGCDDPAVADARARALVRGGGGVAGAENASFWENKAAEIVRCYLLAAALHGADMADVMRWVVSDDNTPMEILGQYGPHVPHGWLGALRKNLAAAPNTLSGYMAGVIPAVSFMDNEHVAATCRPGEGQRLDIGGFLREGGTLYVVAGEQDRRVAPLLTALTEAVFATAKRLAAERDSGRLDPPLTMFLDEVANTTPVPLDQWAADSRGWGITVVAVVQDLAQLRSRWGAQRAQTIFSNLPTKVVLPGVSVKADLEELAYLAGERSVRQTSEHRSAREDQPRSKTISRGREAVLPGHMIYRLPRWHALVMGLGPRPAVVRFTPGYRGVRRGAGPASWPAPAAATERTDPRPPPRLGDGAGSVTPLRPSSADEEAA